MKNILLSTVFTVVVNCCFAQTPQKRNIRFRNLGNDSINLSFNNEYYLIEDSCADIVRYGHMNFKQRIFFGPFKDINKDNQAVVAEGNYTSTGLKDGDFTMFYLNGNLQAKGNFKENKLSGRWEMFYEDGKPKIIFEAEGENIRITDTWNDKGKKIVENGNGSYSVDLGTIVWSGKLNNGIPDGTWKAIHTNDRANTVLVKENFKEGKFQKGNNSTGDYKDASRIILINEMDFPIITAEKMRISSVPCNGIKRQKIVNAQYKDGSNAFAERIKEIVRPFFRTIDLKPYDNIEVELAGEVSDKGEILKLAYTNLFDDRISSGLVRELNKLPFLEPALADGKPVSQKIVFTFRFMAGTYTFRYRLVPLNIN